MGIRSHRTASEGGGGRTVAAAGVTAPTARRCSARPRRGVGECRCCFDRGEAATQTLAATAVTGETETGRQRAFHP
ncbi:hypothetical protein GS506_16355 [Rhodococcus hoagii]|nr:hypothetical protein [Prescottella equi]